MSGRQIGRDGTPSRSIQFGVRPCPAVDVLRTAGIVHAKDERVLEIQPGDRATRAPGEQTFQDGGAGRVRIPQFARMNRRALRRAPRPHARAVTSGTSAADAQVTASR